MALTFSTCSFHPYSLQFSPFHKNQLACCANENYGISGRGYIYIFNFQNENSKLLSFPTSIFDIAWSEFHNSHLFAGTADGYLIFYNLNFENPRSIRKIHEKEIYHVSHSTDKSGPPLILTSSWDGSLSLLDAQRGDLPIIRRFYAHSGLVYCGVFSPRHTVTASASSDGTLRIWDCRSPVGTQLVVKAHQTEVLTCDWCNYENALIATGATDGLAKLWDLRNYSMPISTLSGHQYGIRCLKWSPFSRFELATCSYDRTSRIWSLSLDDQRYHSRVIRHHSEFVYAIDYNKHMRGQIADCSWDRSVNIFQYDMPKHVL